MLQAKAEAKPATQEPALLTISATPIPGTVEEQFISMPDSHKPSGDKDSLDAAEQSSMAAAEQPIASPAAGGQELPWNQASGNIRSPLLRLHTGVLKMNIGQSTTLYLMPSVCLGKNTANVWTTSG